MRICSSNFNLLVSIVSKGDAEDVMIFAKKAGAEGGTILGGRGAGIHDGLKIFGIPFEPEKEVVLILIDQEKTTPVLRAIYDGMEMQKPGKGIIFVLDVDKVAGITHLPGVEE